MKKILRTLGLSLVLMVTGVLLIGCGNNSKKTTEETIGEKTLYNICFNSCGTKIACQQISDDDKVEKVYPHRDGYEFMGWYVDAEYHDKFDFSHQVQKDLTLFAKWSNVLSEVYEFEFASDFNSYMITKYYGETDNLTLPNKFDDLSVTAVDKNVFSCNNDLKYVVIPESIVNIGENAFNSCFDLQDLQILGNINNYGNGAFYDCQNLKEIYFAKQTDIGTYESGNDIFYNAGANTNGITLTIETNVNLPANLLQPHENVKLPKITTVNFIGKEFNAFTDDKLANVKNIEIKNGVTKIANNAFKNYVNLVSVTIPDTIVSIGYGAFEKCSNLSKMNYIGIINNWSQIAFGDCYSNPTYWTKSLVISGQEITNVIVTDEVEKISNYAFYNCENLNSISIPNNVESIGEDTLTGCTGLISITVPGDKFSHSRYGWNPDEYKTNWPNLRNVIITDGSEWIHSEVFMNCTKLMSVILPSTLKHICACAFYGCTSLTSIEIPNSVLYIEDQSFAKTGLTSITIPKGVVSIGNGSFFQIPTLQSINVDRENTVYTSRDNNGIEIDGVIKISDGTLVIGCKNTIISNNVTTIGAHAFHGCEDLVAVIIPNNVTEIRDCAFYDCKSLSSVIIPRSVTQVGNSAFDVYNSNLTVYCEAESRPSGWHWGYHSISAYPDEKKQTRIIWGFQPE